MDIGRLFNQTSLQPPRNTQEKMRSQFRHSQKKASERGNTSPSLSNQSRHFMIEVKNGPILGTKKNVFQQSNELASLSKSETQMH